MALSRIRIGDYFELFSQSCGVPNLTGWDVSGINREKEFFEPSTQVGEDTSKYKIVPPQCFACNLMHVGRDKVLPIAYNYTQKDKIVSPAYSVFKIKENEILLQEYFFIMMKSAERDRYFWFHTDGSIRDGMAWEDFCDMEILLPSVEAQRKYVDIYRAMTANQKAYEKGLADLKLVCDGFIEDLRRNMPCERIGKYIEQSDARNDAGLGLESVRGLSTAKEFTETKADMDGVDLGNYKQVLPQHIAYVPDTSRRGDKISLALNNTGETYLVSSISTVFGTDSNKLLPEYLMLFLVRDEFDRYARYNSWGSARETFDWEEMRNVAIPIPDIHVQRSIADIYNQYIARKEISEKLRARIKDICPVLIKGSLEEA